MYEMIGKTAQPTMTTYHDEHNESELRRMFRYCAGYSMLIGLIFASVVLLYPQVLVIVFGMDNVQNISAVYNAAKIFGIGAVLIGISLLIQNHTQAIGDDKGVFLLVFLQQLGFSVPILLLLSLAGEKAVWFVYPLTEVFSITLFYIVLWIRKKKRAGKEPAVYCTSFSENITEFFNELDTIDLFLSEHGVEKLIRSRTRLSLEEICEAINEHESRQNGILTQLTLVLEGDGSVEVNLRNNATEFDPFSTVRDQLAEKPEATKTDMRALGLYGVREYAQNLLYRQYQGFNTLTYRI